MRKCPAVEEESPLGDCYCDPGAGDRGGGLDSSAHPTSSSSSPTGGRVRSSSSRSVRVRFTVPV